MKKSLTEKQRNRSEKQVLMVENIKISIMLCRLVDGYLFIQQTCCLHLQGRDYGCGILLQNFGNCLHYMVPHPIESMTKHVRQIFFIVHAHISCAS
jgi:hypothetical protein